MLLVPLRDFDPVPRVAVTVEPGDVVPGAATVTVLSTVDGRRDPVRGMVEVPWTGAPVSRLDFAAPFDAAVSYQVQSLDGMGESLGISAGVVLPEVLEGPPPGEDLLAGDSLLPDEVLVGLGLLPEWGITESPALIQCPLDPTLNVQVTLLEGTAADVSRRVSGELFQPMTGDRPVWVGGAPLGGRNARMVVLTDVSGADMVHRITEAYPVWLVRTPPPIRIPRQWHVVAGELVEQDISVHLGGEDVAFAADWTEVAAPAPGLVRSLLTYADLDAAYPSYAVRDAAYGSYSEMDSDWSVAGAAGGV